MRQKILLAASTDLLRFGLREVFKNECDADDIHEATTCEELRTMIATGSFDLAIIHECLVTDMRSLATVNFVLITADPDMSLLRQAYQQHACGYISANINANLLRSILYLDKGSFFLDPVLFPWMMEHMLRVQETEAELSLLSPREREIFGLLQEGVNRRTIAKTLHISESTMKTHIKNINHKRESERHRKTVLQIGSTKS